MYVFLYEQVHDSGYLADDEDEEVGQFIVCNSLLLMISNFSFGTNCNFICSIRLFAGDAS